jgi:hypothetical protein
VQGLGSDLRASKPILLHIRAPAPLQDAQPACRRAAASARSAAPSAMILTRLHGEDPSGYVGRRPRCLLRLRALASLVAAAPPAPPDQASHDADVRAGGEFLSSKRPMLLIFCLVVKIVKEAQVFTRQPTCTGSHPMCRLPQKPHSLFPQISPTRTGSEKIYNTNFLSAARPRLCTPVPGYREASNEDGGSP